MEPAPRTPLTQFLQREDEELLYTPDAPCHLEDMQGMPTWQEELEARIRALLIRRLFLGICARSMAVHTAS